MVRHGLRPGCPLLTTRRRFGPTLRGSPSPGQADRAILLLRKAADLSARNPANYRTEDALDPLSSREDFRLLMDDLAFPADPFAGRASSPEMVGTGSSAGDSKLRVFEKPR